MWEIRYTNWKTKEIIVVRQVPSFALAATIAKELPAAIGWQVIVTKINDTSFKFDVWIWVKASKKWIRLKGKPLSKRAMLKLQSQWDFETAVPIYWPVGVELPTSPVSAEGS
jgi:hypothetical protein